MIKQTRIGKLQKWILTRCYANMASKGHDPNGAFCYKIEIYRDFYHVPCHTKGGDNVKAFFSEPQSVKAVSLSRSISRLLKMGLIHKLGGFYAVVLTDRGIAKAKELLNSEKVTPGSG